MIVSIVCREGTQPLLGCKDVGEELLVLLKYVPAITKARVVFSQISHHKTSGGLIECHLSLQIPNRNSIDIYEHHHSEPETFDLAIERAIDLLRRTRARTSTFTPNPTLPSFIDETTWRNTP